MGEGIWRPDNDAPDDAPHPTCKNHVAKQLLAPRAADTHGTPLIDIEKFVAGPKVHGDKGSYLQKGISKLMFHFYCYIYDTQLPCRLASL